MEKVSKRQDKGKHNGECPRGTIQRHSNEVKARKCKATMEGIPRVQESSYEGG